MPDSKLRIARSVDQAIVRHANERAVLTEIALSPHLSAAAIAKRLRLAPQTVGRIVGDLVESGLVQLGETVAAGPGKPSTPLYTAHNAAFAIGCEIGLEHCELVLLNFRGAVLGSHRWSYGPVEPAVVLRQVVSLVELLCNIVPQTERSRIMGMALASPAALASQLGQMGASEHIVRQWAEIDLAAALGDATGLAITRYAQGSAACWGEMAKLDAPRPGRISYFLLSTFVVAGVVAQGRLLDGGAADLGASLVPNAHGQFEPLHAVAGLQAVLRAPLAQSVATLGSDPMAWDWPALEAVVAPWIADAGKALAVAAANAAACAGCQLAIIDGALPVAVIDRLVAATRAHLETLPAIQIQVQAGRAGIAAPATGAAALLLYRTYFSGEWEHFPADARV